MHCSNKHGNLTQTQKADVNNTAAPFIDGFDSYNKYTAIFIHLVFVTAKAGGRRSASNCLFSCRWIAPSSLKSLGAPHLLSVMPRDINEVKQSLVQALKSSNSLPDGRPKCSLLLSLCFLLPQ